MRTGACAIAALSVLCAAPALAQDCEEGRERVSGRCCWPGQTWSEERGRCEGAPRCPETLVEHGDACIAAAESPGEPAGYATPPGYGLSSMASWSPTPPTTSTDGWPLAEASPSAPSARAVHWRGEDEALIAFSLALFDAGWAMGWIGAIVDESIQSCGGGFSGFEGRSCGSWPLAFVPLVGGLLQSIVTFNGWRRTSITLGHGIVSLILQFVALVAIPISLANETTEAVFQPLGLGHGVTASFDLAAPDADGGLSATLRF